MRDETLSQNFLKTLSGYYVAHGRHSMAWRQPEPDGSFDPYKILVSEMMLQQTQVSRVEPKYAAFITAFPTVLVLADASQSQVLQMWNGLGYNRRARYLWQSANYIVTESGGIFPSLQQDMLRLPGVGPNTAGAIAVYAFNQPSLYVETNIRTVIIHHFFHGYTDVGDDQIRDIMSLLMNRLSTVSMTGRTDTLSPRQFYWALMDYGSYLKATVGNLNTRSKSYTLQSKFVGSKRQLRGQIIRLLSTREYQYDEILSLLEDIRSADVIADLTNENLISLESGILKLA